MVKQKEIDDLKEKLENKQIELDRFKDWLDKERGITIELRKRNQALLKEHKRILDLVFEV